MRAATVVQNRIRHYEVQGESEPDGNLTTTNDYGAIMEHKIQFSANSPLFYNLFQNSRIGQIILDSQNRIAFANQRMLELFGAIEPNVLGKSFGDAFHCVDYEGRCPGCVKADDKRCNLVHAANLIKQGVISDNTAIAYSFFREQRICQKWFQVSGRIFAYEGKEFLQLSFCDITHLQQREKHLKALLLLDKTTGTLNKYGLVKAVKRRIKIGTMVKKYSLCMLDFDNFKQLNDKYGHLFGDHVLEKFSDIAHRHLHKGDILGRYGGEEFIFVFNGADEQQSLEVLTKIQNELAMFYVKTARIPVTFSAGIVTVDSDTLPSYKGLVEQADQLLYKAKQLGRTRAISRLGEWLLLNPKSIL
ncbi:MAG TPA: sensor domain-containing diguanylate cyclase [Clostridia bacterium]|nr:sensor domain-containing diguanylate cyclase [Clostridia bacterium]